MIPSLISMSRSVPPLSQVWTSFSLISRSGEVPPLSQSLDEALPYLKVWMSPSLILKSKFGTESYFPKEREECLANCFQSKIVSGKLSKCLYIHSYANQSTLQLHLCLMSSLFWSITLITTAPQNATDNK